MNDTSDESDLDDHILVSSDGKKSIKYYVGRIMEVYREEKEVTTTFMKRARSSKVGSSIFVFSEEDMFTHFMSDFVMKLPLPTKETSKRAVSLSNFHCSKLKDNVIEKGLHQ